FDKLPVALDLGVELLLVIMVIGHGRVDLSERQVREFFVDFFGAGGPAKFGQHDLDDLRVGVVHPGPALVVEQNMRHATGFHAHSPPRPIIVEALTLRTRVSALKASNTMRSIAVLLAILFSSRAAVLADEAPYDLVIRNGAIVDGTGNPWLRGDVAIRGDR